MPNELDVPDLPEGVKSVNIKEQKVFDGLPFPLVLSPADDFKDKDPQFWNDWVKKHLKVIESLLLKYGAILYRGFPFDTPKDFDEFSKAYGYNPYQNVQGLGVRAKVDGNVYVGSDTTPDFVIPLHHELAHLKEYPLIVFFYCDIPAKEGGNTPIALSNVIFRKMSEREPDFVRRLEKEGLRYLRVAPDGTNLSIPYGRGWQSTFSASNEEEAERVAKAKGYDFEWQDDGSMKTITEILPAIRVDKRTGKTMWFNSAFLIFTVSQSRNDFKNFNVFFPNFETVSAEKVETMRQVLDEVKVSFKWQQKDVIMIDNRAVLHCKDKFSAPPRRILISLYNDHQGPF